MSEIGHLLDDIYNILEAIRDFGHTDDCTSDAPVYECGCFDQDQSELAEEAITLMDEAFEE